MSTAAFTCFEYNIKGGFFFLEHFSIALLVADPKDHHGAVIGTHVRPYPFCCKFWLDHADFQKSHGHTRNRHLLTGLPVNEVAAQSADKVGSV